MADKKISQLTGATTPLSGTEELPIVQSGATTKVSVANLTAGRSISTAGASLDGAVTINDSGADVDFRIESDTNANAFFLQGSDGFIGVGTGTPSYLLHLAASSTTDGPQIRLQNTNTNISTGGTAGVIDFYANDSSTGGTGISGFIKNEFINSGVASVLTFGTRSSGNATEKMRIGHTGDVSIADGNLVIGTSGKGIDFSANTPAAGMTSQLLDDYEEGTWTPTVRGSSTAGTYTLSNTVATYRKIGSQVHLWAMFGFSAASGGTNVVRMDGLPFTRDTTNSRIVGSVTFKSADFTAGITQVCPVDTEFVGTTAAGTRLFFWETVDNAAGQGLPIAAFSTSTVVSLYVTYFV